MSADTAKSSPPLSWTIIALLVLPSLANDLFNIAPTPYWLWVLQDWTLRLLVLGALYLLLRQGRVSRADLGLNVDSTAGLVVTTALLSGVCLFMARWGDPAMRLLLPWPALGHIPKPDHMMANQAMLHVLDVTLGVFLVALSEELLFRGLVFTRLRRTLPAPSATLTAVILAALLFGAIHWSLHPGTMASSVVYGLLFQAGFLCARSIWPGVTAHYLVDLYYFM